MEYIDLVVSTIEERVPGLIVKVDLSDNPQGPHWIDVTNGASGAAIEWRKDKGFGISSLPSEGFGDGPDEIYSSIDELVNRVEELMNKGERTKSSE